MTAGPDTMVRSSKAADLGSQGPKEQVQGAAPGKAVVERCPALHQQPLDAVLPVKDVEGPPRTTASSPATSTRAYRPARRRFSGSEEAVVKMTAGPASK